MVDQPITVSHNRSTVFTRWHQCAWTSNKRFGLTSLTSQMAAWFQFSCFACLMPYSPYVYTLHCATPFPQNLPLPVRGIWTPSNTLFFWPTRSTNPNVISIESAIFLKYMHITNWHNDKTQPVRFLHLILLLLWCNYHSESISITV